MSLAQLIATGQVSLTIDFGGRHCLYGGELAPLTVKLERHDEQVDLRSLEEHLSVQLSVQGYAAQPPNTLPNPTKDLLKMRSMESLHSLHSSASVASDAEISAGSGQQQQACEVYTVTAGCITFPIMLPVLHGDEPELQLSLRASLVSGHRVPVLAHTPDLKLRHLLGAMLLESHTVLYRTVCETSRSIAVRNPIGVSLRLVKPAADLLIALELTYPEAVSIERVQLSLGDDRHRLQCAQAFAITLIRQSENRHVFRLRPLLDPLPPALISTPLPWRVQIEATHHDHTRLSLTFTADQWDPTSWFPVKPLSGLLISLSTTEEALQVGNLVSLRLSLMNRSKETYRLQISAPLDFDSWQDGFSSTASSSTSSTTETKSENWWRPKCNILSLDPLINLPLLPPDCCTVAMLKVMPLAEGPIRLEGLFLNDLDRESTTALSALISDLSSLPEIIK